MLKNITLHQFFGQKTVFPILKNLKQERFSTK